MHSLTMIVQGLLASTAVSSGPTQLPTPAASAAAEHQPETREVADQPADRQAETTSSDIVVTGSRLPGGFRQPTPVTAVTAGQLADAKPGLLSESLAQLPAFKSSVGSTSNANLGVVNLVNLRALGPNRTLVLLDGRRLTPSTTGSAPDINTLPQALVRQVDIVTGGASAAYGSDAVAGVVNFILDDGFTGLKGQIQKGITSAGDGATFLASLSGGVRLADDRLHLLANIEYYKSDGVTEPYSRDWNNRQFGVIPNPAVSAANPASPTNPNLLLRENVRLSNTAVGGLILSGPLAGNEFLAGGTLSPFRYGSDRSSAFMVGGGGPSNGFFTPIQSPIERYSVFGRMKYKIADAATLFVQGTNFNSVSRGLQFAPAYTFTIFSDNAYLPAAVRSQLGSASSFTLARDNLDWGLSRTIDRVKGYDLVAGIKGELGQGWSYDAHVQRGRTSYSRRVPNDPININVYNAADSVVVTSANVGTSNLPIGSIACRTTLSNPGNGCVPLNLFGPNAASAAALDYVYEEASFDQRTRQTAAAANIRGTPFATWAGDVAVAAGLEYRKVSTDVRTDRFSQTLPADYLAANAPTLRGLPATLLSANRGVFLFGNYQPINGSYNVKEVYGEAEVPLARNVSFLQSLSVNGAVRYADYSVSGGATTWKLGGVWQVVEDLRFRATRSRDIRAPNIAEVFSSARLLPVTINDPVTGTTYSTSSFNLGNRALRNEAADTLTAGIVLTPRFIPRLAISLDYYRIGLKGAISSPTALDVINACQSGDQSFCGLITRAAGTNQISSIRLPNVNLANILEKGLDIEASYRIPLAGIGWTGGNLALRALVNHVGTLSYRASPTGVAVNRAGEVAPISTSGGTNVGVPKWSGNVSASLADGAFSLIVQERYVGGGNISNSYNTARYNAPGVPIVYIDHNRVDERFYTDLTAKMSFSRGAQELFVNVTNLFDRDPPFAPFAGTLPLTTNAAYYDVLGRTFTAGFRFRM